MAEVDFDDMEPMEEMDVPTGPPAKEENEKCAFDGTELPYVIINGMPMYQKNHVVDNRCQIFERIGWDDLVGATYLAIAPDGTELVLRVGNEQILIPQLEATFLCKVEEKNLWRSFSQVHSIWKGEKFYFLSLYFRSGPLLRECFQFSGSKFSLGSAGRLALDILQIIRITHNLGYLMRALSLEMFHFDVCSHPIYCRDELEGWLYLFIYLVKGALPWESDRYDNVKWTKIKMINNGRLFQGLPSQFNNILNVITRESTTQPVSDDDYDKLEQLTREIFHDVGGAVNEDVNFDFERDPTEEEIPRYS
uniref:Protein kinase domain-containing protein n=1 Tax=Angiostrongylus cantonensis TaxID=6313 RepID=A0A0K0CV58_ANGCA